MSRPPKGQGAEERRRLRRALRRRRRALPPRRRREAALAVARHGAAWPWLRRCAHVAAYWPADGELEPWPLLERLPGLRVLYLPVVRPGGKLWFAPYGPGAACAANRYGIPEPLAPAVPVRVLDVVLLPLVAFDGQGHRLGMGGGYYDRTLAFLRHRRRRRRPRLVGLAYAFQEVAALHAEPWDVPLDAVITEQGLRLFPGP